MVVVVEPLVLVGQYRHLGHQVSVVPVKQSRLQEQPSTTPQVVVVDLSLELLPVRVEPEPVDQKEHGLVQAGQILAMAAVEDNMAVSAVRVAPVWSLFATPPLSQQVFLLQLSLDRLLK